MKHLKKERWLTTHEAVELLREFLPMASKRWFQSGEHRAKRLDEPRRLGRRLLWNERALKQWLVRQGLTEWSDL